MERYVMLVEWVMYYIMMDVMLCVAHICTFDYMAVATKFN